MSSGQNVDTKPCLLFPKMDINFPHHGHFFLRVLFSREYPFSQCLESPKNPTGVHTQLDSKMPNNWYFTVLIVFLKSLFQLWDNIWPTLHSCRDKPCIHQGLIYQLPTDPSYVKLNRKSMYVRQSNEDQETKNWWKKMHITNCKASILATDRGEGWYLYLSFWSQSWIIIICWSFTCLLCVI